MRYKEFGKTGMQVSEMTLGTWGIGGVGWDDNPKSVRQDAIRAAVEAGVNFFDTAPAYNAGAAERCLGEALADMGLRDKMYISTKCGNVFVDGVTYRRDGSAAGIRRQCEDSLRNLRTDYVDLMLIHWPDPNTPFAETMAELAKLKEEGKIRHVGVSNFSHAGIAANILAALGGKANVQKASCCATRLRFQLKDGAKVDEKALKSAGASGVIRSTPTACQVILGTQVRFVYEELQKLL